jgi:DNA-binding winged helix-turn-helix (wHTH) protein/tetratricopeptide (TPR) repeat protein
MKHRTSALSGSEKPGFSFAGFRLEADGTLLRGETPVHLPPKELAALRLLLANAGRIVTPLQLRQALWGDVHVTADSVPKCLSSLRARLEPEDCIQTVYKRGYRFTAGVRTQGAGPDEALPRLAILPFAGGFGVPEYLGSAIAEETMARLSGSRPGAVSIVAQDSVFTLARREMTALEVGEALKADMVLAGTLRALPMHYRLRAEMIRVEDGTQIWVEDLLVDRDRIAGPETELANRLAFRLNSGVPLDWSSGREVSASRGSSHVPALTDFSTHALPVGSEGETLSIAAAAEPGEENTAPLREAYEIFQRAHHEWQTPERHRMQDGLQHLLRAAELNPSLVGARVDLVNLSVTQGFYGYMSPAMSADIVRRAAESIPDLVVQADAVLPALGWIRFHVDRDLPAALSAFSLSAHLPHDQWTTRVRSMFALSRHRFGEAIDLLRAAIQLDPFSPWLHARLAWALHLASEAGAGPSASPGASLNSSVDQIRHTLRQFPDHAGASLYGTVILAFNGEAERAVEIAHELAQRLPYFDLGTAVHAYALACAGRVDEARSILERLQWLSRERFLLRAFMPAVYVALGELDAALAELKISNEIRCPWFFQMLADPRLRPLESRPEFLEMRAILAGIEAEGVSDEQASS